MKIKLVDNFFSEYAFNEIKKIFWVNIGEHREENNFGWYFADNIADKKDQSDFFFFHSFYKNKKVNSYYYDIMIKPVIDKLKIKNLIRAKANLYTRKIKRIKTAFHTDYYYPHKVCLVNINTNNGYTEFENGKKVYSKENQAILFDGLIKHRSVAQTDGKVRINLNINYD